jgi:hypothetical protein
MRRFPFVPKVDEGKIETGKENHGFLQIPRNQSDEFTDSELKFFELCR